MTTGIYSLIFDNGSTYIGQSVDVERRWEDHENNMLKNKCSAKMQTAFKKYGLPHKTLLIECHADLLDILEAFFIQTVHPDLNTVIPEKLTKEQLEIVEKCDSDTLQKSITDLLSITLEDNSRASVLQQRLDEAYEVIDDLRKQRTKEEIITDKIIELQEEINDNLAEIYALEGTVDTLEAELAYEKLPWYKKIF